MSARPLATSSAQITAHVREALRRAQWPLHLRGTVYAEHLLVAAVTARLMGELAPWYGREAYDSVARHFATTYSRVERSIRHARQESGDATPNFRCLAILADQVVREVQG